MVSDFSNTMLRLAEPYERDVMPCAGGLLDQPNVIVEAMECIRARRYLESKHAGEE